MRIMNNNFTNFGNNANNNPKQDNKIEVSYYDAKIIK